MMNPIRPAAKIIEWTANSLAYIPCNSITNLLTYLCYV